MSRWKAAGIHLLISIAVAIAAFLLLFFVWYPGPLFEATGGSRLVLLLVAIDVVIGPLLTLIVFRAGKRGMKFDLAVIGLLQLAALLYGIHVITAARPAFLVFSVDRISSVSASNLDDADLLLAPDPRHRKAPWTGPELVAIRLPTDAQEKSDLVFEAMRGRDVVQMPRYYRPYADSAREAASARRPLADLSRKEPAKVAAFVERHGGDASKLGYLPLTARDKDMAAILDGDGKVLGYLAIDPWEE